MCFRRQLLSKMWPIQLAFLHFNLCRISVSSLTLRNTSFVTRSVQLIFSILLQHHISRLSRLFLVYVPSQLFLGRFNLYEVLFCPLRRTERCTSLPGIKFQSCSNFNRSFECSCGPRDLLTIDVTSELKSLWGLVSNGEHEIFHQMNIPCVCVCVCVCVWQGYSPNAHRPGQKHRGNFSPLLFVILHYNSTLLFNQQAVLFEFQISFTPMYLNCPVHVFTEQSLTYFLASNSTPPTLPLSSLFLSPLTNYFNWYL